MNNERKVEHMPMSVMQARREDPREYGYLMAQAGGTREYFLSKLDTAPEATGLFQTEEPYDATQRELAIEGWNEFQDEQDREDRRIEG